MSVYVTVLDFCGRITPCIYIYANVWSFIHHISIYCMCVCVTNIHQVLHLCCVEIVPTQPAHLHNVQQMNG